MQFIDTAYFAPGAGWSYSNSNYLILGLIIKQVLNQPLSMAIRNNILTPAGLNNTFLYPEETISGTVPHVWSKGFTGVREDIVAVYNYTHEGGFSMAWAAGGILSTAEDNAVFWSKLIQGQIVNAASLVKMKQTVALPGGAAYGLGIFRYKNFNGRTIYAHGGTNLGFINENLADSISGVGISVLTNEDSVSNLNLRTKVVAALHKVTINPPLGIGQVASNERFTIYPNPAKDAITITGFTEGKAAMLRIYDLTGKEVYNTRVSSYRNILLPLLSNGTYLLKIGSAETGVFSSQLLRIVR
jgi:D-alanyl-D-alanine carboxypeptidase